MEAGTSIIRKANTFYFKKVILRHCERCWESLKLCVRQSVMLYPDDLFSPSLFVPKTNSLVFGILLKATPRLQLSISCAYHLNSSHHYRDSLNQNMSFADPSKGCSYALPLNHSLMIPIRIIKDFTMRHHHLYAQILQETDLVSSSVHSFCAI